VCGAAASGLGGRLRFVNTVLAPDADIGATLRATGATTVEQEAEGFALLGLHACGQLTPTIIRAFASSPSAVALVVAGCCYHKVASLQDLAGWGALQQSPSAVASTASVGRLPAGFPMSGPLATLLLGRGGSLARWFADGHAQELACHAAEGYTAQPWQHAPVPAPPSPHTTAAACTRTQSRRRRSRLPHFRSQLSPQQAGRGEGFVARRAAYAAETSYLARQSWRAVLECELRRRGLPPRQSIGSVRRVDRLSFDQYAQAAFRKAAAKNTSFGGGALGGETGSDGCELAVRYTVELGMWPEYAAFYSLRLLLAPLFESLIVMDRAMFVTEALAGAAHEITVLPAFAPSLSPRNFVIVASRRTSCADIS
jgi:hypothetical protein